MSKNYLILGAALLFTACSTNEVEMTVPLKTQITFSNISDRLPFDTNKDYQNKDADSKGNNYKIYVQSESNEKNWYIVDEVYEHGTNLNKPKNGPHYWLSSNTKLNFYAFSPANFCINKGETVPRSCIISQDKNKQKIAIQYSVPTKANEDLKIANPVYNVTSKSHNGTVCFNFKHALSKVALSVKLSQALLNSGYNLDKKYKLQLTVAKNRGEIDPTISNAHWTNLSIDDNLPLVYENDTIYYIIPQKATNCSLKITHITIKKNNTIVFPLNNKIGELKTYAIKEGDIKVNGEPELDNLFSMGKQYNLNFIIDNLTVNENNDLVFGSEIKFNSETSAWKQRSPFSL